MSSYSSYRVYIYIIHIYLVLFPLLFFYGILWNPVTLARHGHSSATLRGDEHKPHLPSVAPFCATPQGPPSSALPRMVFSLGFVAHDAQHESI